jgi:hypothetical protein
MGRTATAERNYGDPSTLVEEQGTIEYHETEDKFLNPEPSEDSQDPLNWPLWVKVRSRTCVIASGAPADHLQIIILVQTSLLAAIGGLNTAAINPALVLLAQDFGISKVTASYQT